MMLFHLVTGKRGMLLEIDYHPQSYSLKPRKQMDHHCSIALVVKKNPKTKSTQRLVKIDEVVR